MKKNKYVIVMFLGILIMLLLFVLFISNKEGLTNDCKYQYLGTPPDGSDKLWNEDVKNEFINIYNKTVKEILTNFTGINKENVEFNAKSMYTEEEAKYYIKNKKFPINSYMSNLLKNDAKLKAKFNEPVTPDNVLKINSVRKIYYDYIYNDDETDKKSDSFKIFVGEMPEPSCNSNEIMSNESNEKVSNETGSQLSSSDFNKLKNICKSVK
jgi:hypothetical protein